MYTLLVQSLLHNIEDFSCGVIMLNISTCMARESWYVHLGLSGRLC